MKKIHDVRLPYYYKVTRIKVSNTINNKRYPIYSLQFTYDAVVMSYIRQAFSIDNLNKVLFLSFSVIFSDNIQGHLM